MRSTKYRESDLGCGLDLSKSQIHQTLIKNRVIRFRLFRRKYVSLQNYITTTTAKKWRPFFFFFFNSTT
jgi:hypothetical protein